MTYRKLIPMAVAAAVLVAGLSDLTLAKKNKGNDKGKNKPKPAAVTQPIVKVVDLVIHDVTVEEGQLVADAVATLNIAGRTITQDLQIPLDLGGSAGTSGACDVLNLAVGPVHLDLLGLVVDLDDCAGGPVTVDIVAVSGGGLLGDLLCNVAGALNGGTDLADVLAGLTDDELATLTSGLQDVLNTLLGQLLDTGTATTADSDHASTAQAGHICDILNLQIPNGLHLNLLGLQVDTSAICLDVYAQSGRSNLLGNLLCSLSDLLNNNGNNGGGQAALVKNINKLLDRLGL